jgi:hypothetical protein
VSNGTSLDFALEMQLFGLQGAELDFLNTASLVFNLPIGASVTSTGGLSEVGVVASPEPRSVLIVGFPMLLLWGSESGEGPAGSAAIGRALKSANDMAGKQAPALGRRECRSGGAAANESSCGSEQDVPAGSRAGTLPHYPLWDMNRGFGP